MAEFYYQTSTRVRGPWLLDNEQMKELDDILSDQRARLAEYRQEKIRLEVEKELPGEMKWLCREAEKKEDPGAVREALRKRIAGSYQNEPNNLDIVLLLQGGKKLVAKSLREASSHAGVSDAEVVGLNAALGSGLKIQEFGWQS
jgi:hypothetical protein